MLVNCSSCREETERTKPQPTVMCFECKKKKQKARNMKAKLAKRRCG